MILNRLYILGKGIQVVFPILAFSVGDDPAQHRYCGVYEGNALHTCIYCNYSVKNDGLFDPSRRILRDAEAIRLACDVAHGGTVKKEMKRPLLQVERDAIASLNDRGKTYTLLMRVGCS